MGDSRELSAPPIQGLFRSELAGPGSRGSCLKPHQRCYSVAEDKNVGRSMSECPECPTHLELSTQAGDRMLHVSVSRGNGANTAAWDRVAGQIGKLGGLCSAGDSKEGQDGVMSLVLS